MDTIGFDLHKRESQLCILAEDGTVTERRIATTRERLTAVFGDLADCTPYRGRATSRAVGNAGVVADAPTMNTLSYRPAQKSGGPSLGSTLFVCGLRPRFR